MNLFALLLFGSRARGDHSESSDIDLLAITEDSDPSVSGSSKASLYHYNQEWLDTKAKQGDLFVWHLISEAVPIYDPDDRLVRVRQCFSYRSNYDEQIEKASAVGWMIIDLGRRLEETEANRWLSWSVRTISIARAADLRTPAFSAHGLAEALSYPDIAQLVAERNKSRFTSSASASLTDFLLRFGSEKPRNSLKSKNDYESFFQETQNTVGQKILNRKKQPSFYAEPLGPRSS